ncbi:hypothetical protein [Aquihabitans sp. G128]
MLDLVSGYSSPETGRVLLGGVDVSTGCDRTPGPCSAWAAASRTRACSPR